MSRWEILEKAKKALEGEVIPAKDYGLIRKIIDIVLDGEDRLSKEIEERKEELRMLELKRKQEKE